jgi:anti-sigma-K factor RskA
VMLLVVAEAFGSSADIAVSGVRVRVWKRARARMARKASWSEAQFWRGAQATSVRVPFLVLLTPARGLAKVAFMARKEGM